MSVALSLTEGASVQQLPDLMTLTSRITNANLLELEEGSVVTAGATTDWQLVLVLNGVMEPGGDRGIKIGQHLLGGDAFVVAPGHEFTMVGTCLLLHLSYRQSKRPPLLRIRHSRAIQLPVEGHVRAFETVSLLQPYHTDGLRLLGLGVPGHSQHSQVVTVPTVVCSRFDCPIEVLGEMGPELVDTYRAFRPGDDLTYAQTDVVGLGWVLEF